MTVRIPHSCDRDQDGNTLYNSSGEKDRYGSIGVRLIREIMDHLVTKGLFTVHVAQTSCRIDTYGGSLDTSSDTVNTGSPVCVSCITCSIPAYRPPVCSMFMHRSSSVCIHVPHRTPPSYNPADTVEYRAWVQELETYTRWSPEARAPVLSRRIAAVCVSVSVHHVMSCCTMICGTCMAVRCFRLCMTICTPPHIACSNVIM